MIADIVSDYRVQVAALPRYHLHTATSQTDQFMRAAGSDVAATLSELLSKVGVVADCTPKKVAAANKLAYEEARVKSVLPDLDVVARDIMRAEA